MFRCLLILFVTGSNHIASGIHHLPAFVSHPSLSTTTRSPVVRRRHALAFVDSNKELSSQKKFHNIREVAASMVSSNDGNGRLDAEAYHDMASAAVDLTNIYARNGIVSGKFLGCLPNIEYFNSTGLMFQLHVHSPLVCLLQQLDLFATSTPTPGGSSFTIFLLHPKVMAHLLL